MWQDRLRPCAVFTETSEGFAPYYLAGIRHDLSQTTLTPTEQAYTELQHAYDFFNTRLFDGQLPPCLITMQRKNRTYGYFSGNRWNNLAGDVTDEIAMNPAHFATRTPEAVVS